MLFSVSTFSHQNVRHCGKYNGIIEDFDKRLQQLKTESNQKSQALLKEFGEDLEPLIEQVTSNFST